MRSYDGVGEHGFSHLRGSAFFGCQVVEWPGSGLGGVSCALDTLIYGRNLLGLPGKDVERGVGMLEPVTTEGSR